MLPISRDGSKDGLVLALKASSLSFRAWEVRGAREWVEERGRELREGKEIKHKKKTGFRRQLHVVRRLLHL